MSASFPALLQSCERFRLTALGADDAVVTMPAIWDGLVRRVAALAASGKVGGTRGLGRASWGWLGASCVIHYDIRSYVHSYWAGWRGLPCHFPIDLAAKPPLSPPVVQTVLVPQFFKVGRNAETGEGVFILADEFCKKFGVSFSKPAGCKMVRARTHRYSHETYFMFL